MYVLKKKKDKALDILRIRKINLFSKSEVENFPNFLYGVMNRELARLTVYREANLE